jgi:hypothetical protein
VARFREAEHEKARRHCSDLSLVSESDLFEQVHDLFDLITKEERECITSTPLPSWFLHIPEICALAKEAETRLLQHALANQGAREAVGPARRTTDGAIVQETSLEQLWRDITAQTHAQAVKLGYRGDVERWREFIRDDCAVDLY